MLFALQTCGEKVEKGLVRWIQKNWGKEAAFFGVTTK